MSTHWVPQYQLQICWYKTVLFPTRVLYLSLSLSLSLFFTLIPPPKRSPTSRNPKLAKLSKSNCAKPQHHQSEWCSSSSSRTCLRNIPVPLSIWTWLKDLVAPHFPASTALDLSLISNSRKLTRRNPRLWTLNTTQVFDIAHLPANTNPAKKTQNSFHIRDLVRIYSVIVQIRCENSASYKQRKKRWENKQRSKLRMAIFIDSMYKDAKIP